MKTSNRFNSAIDKLYNSFHGNTLIPECCKQCAVGNICNNTDSWRHLTDNHGSRKLNYVGIVNENLGRRIQGFKPSELLAIEASFLRGCGYSLPLNHASFRPENPMDKEVLFDGLCEAVSFLCKLEGIPDLTDYSKLFDFEPTSSDLLLA